MEKKHKSDTTVVNKIIIIMGGNAVPNATRMSLVEYRTVVEQVSTTLEAAGVGFRVTVPLANKTEFGDVDVLVDDVDRAVAALAPPFVTKNSNVTSVSWSDKVDKIVRQVDLIATTPECMEQAWLYLSYGVFGMCVGVCVKPHGLVYDPHGLHAVVGDVDNGEKRVLLSSDAASILGFLGIDARVLGASGISDEHDLVALLRDAAPTLDFDRLVQKVAHIRQRAGGDDVLKPMTNKRAKQYKFAGLLERALKSHDQIKDGYNNISSAATTSLMELAVDHFEKRRQVASLLEAIQFRRRVAEKFNGSVVKAATGLVGPELGKFIAAFRRMHTDADIDAMSHDDVMRACATTSSSIG